MNKSRFFIVGVLLIIVQHSYGLPPDEWQGRKESILWQNWSVNLNVGFTSYFGDLSQYDLEGVNKLMYESKPSYSVKFTKYIRDIFGISGQVIYGGFGSDYRPEHSFETRLVEYSLQAGIEVFGLLFPQKSTSYGLEVYVGTGQFLFRTTKFTDFDNQQASGSYTTGVPEFVYFFGGGLFFNVSERIRITTDLSIRQAQNDNIDKYLANGNFDYYSLLSFGITYSLGKIIAPVRDEPRLKVNAGNPIWR